MCLLLIPLVCDAQAQASDNDFCRNGLFPREQEHLSLGVVQGQKDQKIHFFDDYDGCPAKGTRCMRVAYLVLGDEVLVGKSTADWVCVWYQGRNREYVSWMPKTNIALVPTPPVHPIRDWVGVWSDGSGTIRISPLDARDTLEISSKLRWDGGDSPAGYPIANFGGITAVLNVNGPQASASDGVCQVALTRIGRYLVADDNGNCGGMNVRHTGVYFRRPQ
jgi:hypothetical protein